MPRPFPHRCLLTLCETLVKCVYYQTPFLHSFSGVQRRKIAYSKIATIALWRFDFDFSLRLTCDLKVCSEEVARQQSASATAIIMIERARDLRPLFEVKSSLSNREWTTLEPSHSSSSAVDTEGA